MQLLGHTARVECLVLQETTKLSSKLAEPKIIFYLDSSTLSYDSFEIFSLSL